MKDEIKQYIDNHIVENPNIDLNKLSVLTEPDELHYLASVVNWDIHIPLIEWIVKQSICSEATALMIFWQAQPQDFTVYRWNETQIKEDISVFHLIKIIIINYINGFYLKTDIHYNPANDKKDISVIPDFMYKDVKGEEPYSIYDEQDVKSWFGEYLNKQINSCSSTMDLYGIACNLPIIVIPVILFIYKFYFTVLPKNKPVTDFAPSCISLRFICVKFSPEEIMSSIKNTSRPLK